MKTTTLVVAAVAGVVALSQTFPEKIKPSKEELPEVIIEGAKPMQRDFTRFCPRTTLSADEAVENTPYVYEDSDGNIRTTRHCSICRAGVYVENSDSEGKHCSFCGEKEHKSND
jgi:hypothetical protein